MQHAAHIGPSIVIKGEISAKEPFSLAGRVEGRIAIEGHALMIHAGAHVESDVAAESIIIAGTLHGTVVATDRIELRPTAVVEGDLSAARIAVQDGALMRGTIAAAGH
jgi:cytoskeletal protein CcmA (bactofilin family)